MDNLYTTSMRVMIFFCSQQTLQTRLVLKCNNTAAEGLRCKLSERKMEPGMMKRTNFKGFFTVDRRWGFNITRFLHSQAGLCDNTVTEYDIVIDVVLLQNLPILRRYWYCKSWVLSIGIDIAKKEFLLLVLVLILQVPQRKFCYWNWISISFYTIIDIGIAGH